jgi:hypothetical protein
VKFCRRQGGVDANASDWKDQNMRAPPQDRSYAGSCANSCAGAWRARGGLRSYAGFFGGSLRQHTDWIGDWKTPLEQRPCWPQKLSSHPVHGQGATHTSEVAKRLATWAREAWGPLGIVVGRRQEIMSLRGRFLGHEHPVIKVRQNKSRRVNGTASGHEHSFERPHSKSHMSVLIRTSEGFKQCH